MKPLTNAQQQVLDAAIELGDLSAKAIAARLNLGTRTVESHKTQVAIRLGHETFTKSVLATLKGMIPPNQEPS